MPQVQLPHKMTAGWKQLLSLCESASNRNELDDLFTALLTPEERLQLTQRAELVKLLLRGDMSQRKIAQKLGVGIATVTRGSNMLKSISPKLIEFFKKNLLIES